MYQQMYSPQNGQLPFAMSNAIPGDSLMAPPPALTAARGPPISSTNTGFDAFDNTSDMGLVYAPLQASPRSVQNQNSFYPSSNSMVLGSPSQRQSGHFTQPYKNQNMLPPLQQQDPRLKRQLSRDALQWS